MTPGTTVVGMLLRRHHSVPGVNALVECWAVPISPQPDASPEQWLVLCVEELPLAREAHVPQDIRWCPHRQHLAADDIDESTYLGLDAVSMTTMLQHVGLKPQPPVHELIVQRCANLGTRPDNNLISRL